MRRPPTDRTIDEDIRNHKGFGHSVDWTGRCCCDVNMEKVEEVAKLKRQMTHGMDDALRFSIDCRMRNLMGLPQPTWLDPKREPPSSRVKMPRRGEKDEGANQGD